MRTKVIVPPAPIMTPADISGGHAADDVQIERLIAAAQETIDGPDGWLGRSLGVQTIEATLDGLDWPVVQLPCPPLVEIVSIRYRDAVDLEHVVSADIYERRDDDIWLKRGKVWPSGCHGPVKIRYRAGYDGIAVADGGTGPVPERVKRAIALAVAYARTIGTDNLFLRSEEVEGIGTRTYTVSSVASDLIHNAIDRELQGLRRYA